MSIVSATQLTAPFAGRFSYAPRPSATGKFYLSCLSDAPDVEGSDERLSLIYKLMETGELEACLKGYGDDEDTQDTLLCALVRADKHEMLKQVLVMATGLGFDAGINSFGGEAVTPLFLAATLGYEECVRVLRERHMPFALVSLLIRLHSTLYQRCAHSCTRE